MSSPHILPGSILHLNAARAKLGTAPGNNADPTAQFYDLSGQANHGTLTNFAYEAGNRPRTNVETDKAIWHDQSGNGNDGTLNGFAFTEVSGWTDESALKFAGAQYVALPDLSLAEGKVFTYEVQFALDSLPANHAALVSESNTGSNSNYTMLYVNIGGYLCFHYNDGTTLVSRSGGASVVTSNLVQGLVVCDGTTAQLYLHGVAHMTPLALPGGTPTINAATIGLRRTLAPAYYFPGMVAVARIYNRALSPEEVAQNHAAGPTGTDYVRTGLVLDLNAARAVRPSGWVSL